ncbi:MAG: prepilin-type N-terminal cleavage/methylation domain-containing protein [Planctomycetaceae bacterium]|nr:prepilin-type N-terminal cleavage/methylation domain-containing protein [Planctomycetaceae bacterium]
MATRTQWLQRSRRTGLTLVESLVSVTITAIAGVALFSAIGASLGASYSALNQNRHRPGRSDAGRTRSCPLSQIQ